MTLPAFATLEEFEARLVGALAEDSDDEERAQAALDDVSALIRVEAGKDWVTDDDPPVLADDIPDIVKTVTIRAALRAYNNPTGTESRTHSLGQFSESESFADSSSDVYLTSSERRLIRLAAGRRAGLGVIPVTRGALETHCGAGDTVYADTLPGPKQIPWASQSQLDALEGL